MHARCCGHLRALNGILQKVCEWLWNGNAGLVFSGIQLANDIEPTDWSDGRYVIFQRAGDTTHWDSGGYYHSRVAAKPNRLFRRRPTKDKENFRQMVSG